MAKPHIPTYASGYSPRWSPGYSPQSDKKETQTFLSNPSVPYENNASERGVRKIKIKQKVSGKNTKKVQYLKFYLYFCRVISAFHLFSNATLR